MCRLSESCVGYSRANEDFFLLRIGNFHDAVDENARRHDMLRIDLAGGDDLRDLRNGSFRGHAHQRVKIAPGLVVDKVAIGVAKLGLDDGKVGLQPALLHIGAAVKLRDNLALRQFSAKPGRGVESRNARTARADALGKRALRHQFQLDFAGQIAIGEGARIRRAREGADHLPDHARIDHRGDADTAIAGIVIDDSQVLGAFVDECVDQLDRRAGAAETADHDR
ncbi:Hypothetical protein AT6N2_L1987 [Agrobacterium tumefaciens]|nr:Hypothetical protein AT6N2_L1987 [Agrobacterium tumefaciens]